MQFASPSDNIKNISMPRAPDLAVLNRALQWPEPMRTYRAVGDQITLMFNQLESRASKLKRQRQVRPNITRITQIDRFIALISLGRSSQGALACLHHGFVFIPKRGVDSGIGTTQIFAPVRLGPGQMELYRDIDNVRFNLVERHPDLGACTDAVDGPRCVASFRPVGAQLNPLRLCTARRQINAPAPTSLFDQRAVRKTAIMQVRKMLPVEYIFPDAFQ